MEYINIKCPSCGAQNSYKTTQDHGFCTYCGTKIPLAPSGSGQTPSDIMNAIYSALESGQNKSPHFRELLEKSRAIEPDNDEISAMIESEIWDADIEGCDLVGYYGSAQHFTVPFCIKRIRRGAFKHAKKLEECVMHENLEFIGTSLFSKSCKDITIVSPDVDCLALRYAQIKGCALKSEYSGIPDGAFKQTLSTLKSLSDILCGGKRHIKEHYEDLAEAHLAKENGQELKQRRTLFLILTLSFFGVYYLSMSSLLALVLLIPFAVFLVFTIIYDKKYQLYLIAANISRYIDQDTVLWEKRFADALGDAFFSSGHISGYDFWNKTESELSGDGKILSSALDFFSRANVSPSLSYAVIQKNMFVLPKKSLEASVHDEELMAVLDGMR